MDEETVYEWAWCGLCEVAMIRCPGCGLNTCSAGEDCEQCKGAYDYWYSHEPPTGEELQLLKDKAEREHKEWCARNPEKAKILKGIFGDMT